MIDSFRFSVDAIMPFSNKDTPRTVTDMNGARKETKNRVKGRE